MYCKCHLYKTKGCLERYSLDSNIYLIFYGIFFRIKRLIEKIKFELNEGCLWNDIIKGGSIREKSVKGITARKVGIGNKL